MLMELDCIIFTCLVNFRCYPGIVSAADANEVNPRLDDTVLPTIVRRRRQSPSLQISVNAEADSAAARRLQVRARSVAGRNDDDRTRV